MVACSPYGFLALFNWDLRPEGYRYDSVISALLEARCVPDAVQQGTPRMTPVLVVSERESARQALVEVMATIMCSAAQTGSQRSEIFRQNWETMVQSLLDNSLVASPDGNEPSSAALLPFLAQGRYMEFSRALRSGEQLPPILCDTTTLPLKAKMQALTLLCGRRADAWHWA